MEIFQKRRKSAAELCQKFRIVTIDIVINSNRVMGIRVTISCRYCVAFEVMLLLPAGTADIKFTHRPKIRFFVPQERLVAPIHFKFGSADGHVGPVQTFSSIATGGGNAAPKI